MSPEIRWYADEVERATFSSKVMDNPKYRLQYWDGNNWLDVPGFIADDAKIIEINFTARD